MWPKYRPLSYGQLCVALLRAQLKNNITVLVKNVYVNSRPGMYTKNLYIKEF